MFIRTLHRVQVADARQRELLRGDCVNQSHLRGRITAKKLRLTRKKKKHGEDLENFLTFVCRAVSALNLHDK